jgi:hypothetical protein
MKVSTLEDFLSRLSKVRKGYSGNYTALCPAHDDRNPSLSITQKDDRVLIHCFAGCSFEEILAAIDVDRDSPILTGKSENEGSKK